jgi:urea transport system permease protein
MRIASLAASLLLTLLVFIGPADAQDDPFAGLAGTSYEDIRRGLETLALSGSKQAAATISALQAGTLYIGPNRALYIKSADGFTNARTGEPARDAPTTGLKPMRVNNAVRAAAQAAMGSLSLFSTDAHARAEGAEAVFKSRDPAALPALDRALAAEKDVGVRQVMRQARAAAVLAQSSASQADKLDAIATLRTRGDLDARSILSSLSQEQPDIAKVAADAVIAVDRTQRLWNIGQSVFYGLSLGSVLLLAAAGLAITFGVMGVINMAHGEMVMIGAYTTFVMQELIRAYAPGLFGASVILAVPLAFLVAGAIGIGIERCLIRFLYGRPLETLLATWGLSLILQQAVRSIFGPSNRDVGSPGWMSGATQLGGLTITYNRMYIIVFAVLVMAALMGALRFTSLGLRMRAVTQNRRMAATMGIRTPWIDALTFGLGSGVAGIAGVALSQIDNVSPNLGQSNIIDSFMVVVFGGVGNLWGTVVSALTLGIVNKFLEPVAGAVLAKIFVLVLLILFIQRKPRGLFPLKGRAVEA